MTTRIIIKNDGQTGHGASVTVRRSGYPATVIEPGNEAEFYVWLGGGDITGIVENPPVVRTGPIGTP